MVRWTALALALVYALPVQAQNMTPEQHKAACRVFTKNGPGMIRVIEQQREVHSGRRFDDIATNLPTAAADAARKVQIAESAVEAALRTLRERLEDFDYQLKLCAR